MKKYAISAIAAFALISCNPEKMDDSNPGIWDEAISTLTDYSLNDDAQQVYDDASASEYELAVVNTSNFGEQKNRKLAGVARGYGSVTISGQTYNANLEPDNFMLYEQDGFSNMYGQNVELSAGSEYVSFYSPEVLAANKVSTSNDGWEITSGGSHELTWNEDPSNPTEKVVIYYVIYEGDNMSSGELDSDYIVTEDDGTYDISSLVNEPGAASLYINIGRGNGAKFASGEEESYTFFNVRSSDHHYYQIIE